MKKKESEICKFNSLRFVFIFYFIVFFCLIFSVFGGRRRRFITIIQVFIGLHFATGARAALVILGAFLVETHAATGATLGGWGLLV